MVNQEAINDISNYAIVSVSNISFDEMSNSTEANKKKYAEKHGYQLFIKKENLHTDNRIYFDKHRFLLEVLDANPNIKWVWWLDCDAVITNMKIRFEMYCDDSYWFVASEDHNDINNGSCFLKNCEESKKLLKEMLAKEFDYLYTPPYDNLALIDICKKNPELRKGFKIHRQKDFNSYFNLGCEKTRVDGTGELSHWEPDDFVIHFAGYPNDVRIPLINFMKWFIKE